jgi:hypothetical protein
MKKIDEPLTPKEAIKAMLEGEVLYDDCGNPYWWNENDERDNGHFERTNRTGVDGADRVWYFSGLYRKPAPKKRLMTRWEYFAWTQSDESKGWLVRSQPNDAWTLPERILYHEDLFTAQRARFTKDGVDKSTITDFTVEEETV